MERFRNTWLAIVGGAILVTLSVSAAFGAAPSGASDGTRGQTIAGFVHGLIFDAGQDADEEAVESDACDADDEDSDSEADATESAEAEADDLDAAEECDLEDCDVDEVDPETSTESFGAVLDSEQCDADDQDEDEDAEEAEDAPDDEDAGASGDGSHGACVREVAHDKDAVGGKNDNHGGAVSEAARFTCHEGADDSEEDADDGEATDAERDEKAAAAEARAAEKEARKAEKEARKAERAEARESKGHSGGDDEDEDEDEELRRRLIADRHRSLCACPRARSDVSGLVWRPGGSVAALGRTIRLVRQAGLLLRVRTRALVDALVLQVALLLGELLLAVLGALRLVDVLVDPILRDGAPSRVTHGSRTAVWRARRVEPTTLRAPSPRRMASKAASRSETDALRRSNSVERQPAARYRSAMLGKSRAGTAEP